ncbi:spore germination protein GerPB [Paenibacillus flagellatus]|uniref:Spore gernimation protein n=1 Tax=Paenibacillus flagellatus TaxID=2211139 RepID=A0A2V5KUS7_9BACL|nr:spore germination protein GerPB [Paenibacillus flagellatus]PYI55737.1 spore gernimation protein [Paenibacillus flagellatus]
MNLIVHQSIVIHQLRVDSVSNSSVLQIGSAGVIKGLSNLYNTGGFTGPAPAAVAGEASTAASLVPLTSASPRVG